MTDNKTRIEEMEEVLSELSNLMTWNEYESNFSSKVYDALSNTETSLIHAIELMKDK